MAIIIEHFYTIQGEGPNVGIPSYLIRFSKCTLKCPTCFGVMGGRRKPRIIMSNKQNKKILDVKVGDKLLTFDNDNKLVETIVTKTFSREVEEWIELKINNILYCVTIDHKFFTTRGILEAKNLKVGDMIYHAVTNDKLSFRMSGSKNPMKNPEISKKVSDKIDRNKQGKKLSNRIKQQKKLGIYKSSWDKMTSEKKLATRKLISESKKGEKNPNWGGGKKSNYNKLAKKCRNNEIIACQRCGSINKKLEIHHLDENVENDNLNNMITICHKCHSRIHRRGCNFWASKRKDGKIAPNMKITNGLEVQNTNYINIKNYKSLHHIPKLLKVYNFSCHPYNTYLVDYMWVHNCDSKYSLENIGIDASEFNDKIIPKHCKNIIITGGEPTMNFYPVGDSGFITLLKRLHYVYNKHVDIETNAIPHIKMIKDSNIYKNIHYFDLVTKGQDISYIVSPKFDIKAYPSKTPEGKNIPITMDDIFKFYRIKDRKTVGLKRTYYKIVYTKDSEDVIKEFITNNISNWFKDRLFIMPLTPTEMLYPNLFQTEYNENCRETIEFCKKHGLRYTPRVHIDVYGLERGV